MRRALVLAVSLATGLGLAVPTARAHGGRPQTYDVLFGASDADLVVPGTFGVMASRDGGAHWDWLCIEGMPDAVRGWMRPAARAADDTVLFAQSFGLVLGRDRACRSSYEATLEGHFVTDVVVRPDGGLAAIRSDGDGQDRVFVASGPSEAFAPAGDPFPAGFLAERIRYAPARAGRVYVSGQTMIVGTSSWAGWLLVSDDGAATFRAIEVPLESDETVLRLLAVDPADADHLFAVAQASTSDRLIEIGGAGDTQASVLVIDAAAIAVSRPFGLGFASDGSVWLGNTLAGLYVIPAGGGEPQSVDKYLRVACVVPRGDDVYLCGDGLDDDFALGVQRVGEAYAPRAVMTFAQLTEPRRCGTPLDAACREWWNDLLIDTGRAALVPDADVPDGAAAPASDAAVAFDAGAAAFDAATPSDAPRAGCACRAGPGARASTSLLSLALLALVAGLRRSRRARRRPACRPSS